MKESYEKYTTAYIMNHFNISRQTLYNWIKQGLISEPSRDWRGWRIWTEESIYEIQDVILNKKSKDYKNNNFLEVNELYINNRRYLGSKYKLLPFIKNVVKDQCGHVKTFSDVFAGTGVVGHAFNKVDTKVIVNDILYSNYLSYITWFSDEKYDSVKINKLINELNHISCSKENYVSRNFGNKYFTMDNAKKIGAIRQEIELISPSLSFREKAILITSLIYAIDKAANTCGHYDAFRKKMDTIQPLKLQIPIINDKLNKNNEIYREDANKLVRTISSDLVYIDTPYNSRQYSDSYHLLENIAQWNKPEVCGVAKKMIDRSHIKSSYCTMRAPQAFDDLINNIEAKYILVSYSNMTNKGNGRSNAKISDEEIIASLEKRGEVIIFDKDFQCFTAGKTYIKDHKERLFLCICKKGKKF